MVVHEIAGVAVAVIVLAGIAVAILNGGNTANVLKASTDGFANVVGTAARGGASA